MYSSEIPTKPPGTLTHPFTLANLASESIGPSSCLLSPADCPVLPTSLFCSGIFLPSSSAGLVWDLARKPFVWVSRQNRQMDPLTGTHPHTHNECPTSCHNSKFSSFSVFRLFSPSLYSQRWVLRLSFNDSCRTREISRNLKPFI